MRIPDETQRLVYSVFRSPNSGVIHIVTVEASDGSDELPRVGGNSLITLATRQPPYDYLGDQAVVHGYLGDQAVVHGYLGDQTAT